MKSLNGTGSDSYRACAIRENATVSIHLQIPSENKSTYAGFDIPAPTLLWKWVQSLPHLCDSLAGPKGNKYVAAQIRIAPDNTCCWVQIPSPTKYNRPYGAAFTLNSKKILNYMRGIMA